MRISMNAERRILLRGCVTAVFLFMAFTAGYGAFGAPPAGVHTVIIEGLRYAPPIIEVSKGDTVVWRNKDPFPHTVTAARSFDSGEIPAGKSWKFKANQVGEFSYICTLHPTMKGTLVVK